MREFKITVIETHEVTVQAENAAEAVDKALESDQQWERKSVHTDRVFQMHDDGQGYTEWWNGDWEDDRDETGSD